MDLEGARLRKVFGKIFARGLLFGIEQADHENLMDEFIVIGEGEGLAAIDGHLGWPKGPAALDNGVGRIRGKDRAAQSREEQNRKIFSHLVTTSR